VWQDARDNPDSTLADVYGARLTLADSPTVHPDITVSGAVNAELAPAVASNGTNCLVVWSDNRNTRVSGRDVLAARLDAARRAPGCSADRPLHGHQRAIRSRRRQ